jgi:peroxiredoxin
VRDRLAEFGDAEVVLVLFTRQRNLRGYRARVGIPYTVVTSEDRAAYRAYGLGRGSPWRVYGLRALRRYAQLLRRGRRLERPTEDTLQLGGDFVVDRDGRLVYAYRSSGPDDRPPVDDLIRFAQTA